MSKRSLASLSLPFVLAPLAACVVSIGGASCSFNTIYGSGVVATEARTVSTFTRVEVNGSADVVAQVGGAPAVSLSGDDNLLQYVTTEVVGDTLVIEMERGSYSWGHELEVNVSMPSLEAFAIRGSSDSELIGVSGGDLDLSISGSGDVRATGSVDRLDVAIRGSGDMRLEDLDAREASVSISGSGDVRLRARDTLDISISGSGDVRYHGDPRVTQSVAGSGDVTRL